MRQWLIVLAATVIMALGFLATVSMLADDERLKQLLARHVEMQTGRQLSIDGDVSVRFFPRFRIQADQVRLSGPTEFAGPELLSSDHLMVELRLLPLIHGRVETREVFLQGARLQVAMDEAGDHSLAGLMRRPGRPGAPGIAASGPLRLENVEIEIGSLEWGPTRQIQVDRIELDGLAFDRALNLRFEGAIGRPPMLSDVSVDGVLLVPAGTGRLRLADMRFSARHAAGGVPFELLGAMSFSAVPPLTIELDRSRLRFGGQELLVEGRYEEMARPRFALHAAGAELDLATMVSLFGALAASQWPVWLANWVAEHDFGVDLALERLAIGPYVLPELRLSVAAEAGMAQLRFAETSLPGALVQAEGTVHSDDAGSSVEALASLDVDDLGALLRAGGFDLAAEGVGQVRIKPGSAADDNALAVAQLEFFSGRLAGLERLRGLAGIDGQDRFDTLTGRLLIHADATVLDSILIHDQFSEVRLQGLMMRGSGRLSGTVLVEAADDIQRFRLDGFSPQPEFAPINAVPVAQ